MTPLLADLHHKKKRIETLSRQFGARRIRVFGSVAKGQEGPDSDVDFLVDFPRGYDLFKQRLPLQYRLKELLGRNIDLVPEHELSPHLRERVFKEAIEL